MIRPLERLRNAMWPSEGLAQVEGLAAGTGLLTGDVIDRKARAEHLPLTPCPRCGAGGEVLVIDLVAHRTQRSCTACSHRWVSEDEHPADR